MNRYSGSSAIISMAILCCLTLAIAPSLLLANTSLKLPVSLLHFSVNELLSVGPTLELECTVKMPGDYTIFLHLPKTIVHHGDSSKKEYKNLGVGAGVECSWAIECSDDGLYLIQVSINCRSEISVDSRFFKETEMYAIYVEVFNGEVISAGYDPPAKYRRVPRRETSTVNCSNAKVYSDKDELTRFAQESDINAISNAAPYTIHLFVSGRIEYEYSVGATDGFRKGIPGVKVWLDWDSDDDPGTAMYPSALDGIRHGEYDITDMDGSYYFNVTFLSDEPADQISPRLRVWVRKSNEACIDADTWGGQFPTYAYIDVPSSGLIYATDVVLNLDSAHGSALRHLYRGRQFSSDEFSHPLDQIAYFIRPGEPLSKYCRQGCFGPNRPVIVFNGFTEPETGYHEYGHYVMHDLEGAWLPLNDYEGDHWFTLETTYNTAWCEGWAEFYSAAAHTYWYRTEQNTWRERDPLFDYGEGPRRYYQFLDQSMSYLDPDTDWKKVEGAIACLLYSLWDDTELRAVTCCPGISDNYTGDNDDIALIGTVGIFTLTATRHIYQTISYPTPIESFYCAAINLTESKYWDSISAIYNSMILKNGSPRSATPNELSIEVSNGNTDLNWDNFICPSDFITLDRAGHTMYTYRPIQNLPEGLVLFRKQALDSFDGDLDGYTAIDTVSSSSISWSEPVSYEMPQSFVVAAYNSSGVSLPQAEIKFNPPVYIMTPTASENVSDEIQILGTVNNKDDLSGFSYVSDLTNITVEWGAGINPTEWSDYGIMKTCDSCPLFESAIATWNTGVVPSGQYTIRVIAEYGTDSYEIKREVQVKHRSALVEHGNPDAFESIQDGVNWAERGDTLLVSGGQDYSGNLIMKESVHLISTSGQDRIIGVGDNPTITISDHNYPCFIEGFEIIHQNPQGYTNGRGIVIGDASPVFTDCSIKDNEAYIGGGVRVEGKSAPVFSNCEISNNMGRGVVVVATETSRPIARFYGCVFDGNEGGGGSAVTIEYPTNYPLLSTEEQPEFINCDFYSNTSIQEHDWFGTVFVNYCDDVLFENCVFVNNGTSGSWYTGGAIAGDFGGTIKNCTFVDNNDNAGSGDCFAAIDLKNASRNKPLDLVNNIVAFNAGPAVLPYDPNDMNVLSTNCIYYQNNPCVVSAPSDAALASGLLGANNFNENPSFCDRTNGDYRLYAYSHGAPGAETENGIGALGVACTPNGTASVIGDTLLLDGSDYVLVGCPAGHNPGYHVIVDLDDAGIERTIRADEVQLDFGQVLNTPPATVYDDDGVVMASSDLNSANSFSGVLSHYSFGGYTEEPIPVPILINGAPLNQNVDIHFRTFDESGAGPGEYGVVDIVDLNLYSLSHTSPPNVYEPKRDYNVDGVIDMIDFSLFSQHYLHESLHTGIQQVEQNVVQQTAVDVTLNFTEEFIDVGIRELRVDVTLENLSVFKAMCVSLRNENAQLTFKTFIPNEYHQKPIMVTPVRRDGVDQVFMGIIGSKTMVSSILFVGTIVFDVNGGDTYTPDEDDFELLVGDVLLTGGEKGSLQGTAVKKSEVVKRIYRYTLSQNFPNPFNPTTTITYSIANTGHTTLSVYNVRGQLVKTLVNETKHKGIYSVPWNGMDENGSPVASGVYFYRLVAGEFVQTKKMLLLK